jgi:hypothetical protein
LGDYNYPLPNSIIRTGDLDLDGYNHPLPTNLKAN